MVPLMTPCVSQLLILNTRNLVVAPHHQQLSSLSSSYHSSLSYPRLSLKEEYDVDRENT